jgi:signal transduction histidine kinase
MWFGTPEGVSAMSRKGWRTYTRKEGLPSEDVNCLLQDSRRILWIGTADGLAYLDDGHVHVPREVPESLQAQIFGIEEDNNGWLWIATSEHVLRVSRDKLLGGDVKSADVHEYGQADGLESTEGVKRNRSVVSDSDGRIWFSLNSGLSVVNPSHDSDNSVPALPHIEAITADDNPVNLAASVQIPSSPRRITFEYTGLSLAVPGRIRFRYFLENFDSNWSQPVAVREAVYTNLGPGSYRFRLVASNSEGHWNGPETTIALNVAPAYYQTYWFRLSCVAAFMALLWGFYQLRMRQVAREFNVRLDERVSERTRIARELHDTLLQNVQGLILKIHAIAKRIPATDSARQGIDKTLDYADQVLAEGRDRVRNLRALTVGLGELPKAFQQIVEESAPNRSSTFKTVVEGTLLELHPIIREETYRIGREALINSLTHSEAHNIEVEITYESRAFRVRIRDDGRGIDPGILEKGGRDDHWGLQGMRERAKRIGAKLELWSRPESGTEVELTVPAAMAYRSPRSKPTDSRPRVSAGG